MSVNGLDYISHCQLQSSSWTTTRSLWAFGPKVFPSQLMKNSGFCVWLGNVQQLTGNEDCVYPASLRYNMHFFDIHTYCDKYVSLVHLQNMQSVVLQKLPLQCLVVPCSLEFLLHRSAVDKTDMYFVTGCNYKIDLWFITSST